MLEFIKLVMDAIYLFLFLISAFSFGWFLTETTLGKNFKKTPVGLYFFLGSLFIPLILFLFSVIFGELLSTASRWTFLLGLFILIFKALQQYLWSKSQETGDRLLSLPSQPLPINYKHPLFLILALILLLAVWKSPFHYFPHNWDEFSHWQTMPKQFYIFDTFISKGFPHLDSATYTPAWPTLIIYPFLILKSPNFPTPPTIYIVICFSLFFFFALYETLTLAFSERKSLLLSLFIFVFHMVNPTIPTHTLIDPPLIYIGTFLIAFLMVQDIRNSSPQLSPNIEYHSTKIPASTIFLLGFLLCAAYFLKTPMTLLFVPALFWILLHADKFSKKNLLTLFINILGLLIPTLIFAYLWHQKTIHFKALFPVSKGAHLYPGLIHDLLKIYGKMGLALLKDLLEKPQGSLFIFLAFWIIFQKNITPQNKNESTDSESTKKLGELLGPSLSYFLIYFLGLGWLYVTSYSHYERDHLASFSRYMSLVNTPLYVSSFIFTVYQNPLTKIKTFKFWRKKLVLHHPTDSHPLNVDSNHMDSDSSPPNSSSIHQNNNNRKLTITMISLAVLILIINVFNIFNRKPNSVITNFQKLSQDGWIQGGDHVQIIDQNSNGDTHAQFYYLQLLPSGKKIIVTPQYRFANIQDSIWTTAISAQNFQNLIAQADLIWVQNSNSWSQKELGKLTLDSPCDLQQFPVFLRKTSQGTYQCKLYEK